MSNDGITLSVSTGPLSRCYQCLNKVMDWGMMKKPQLAAAAVCAPSNQSFAIPTANGSNGTFSTFPGSPPTRNSSGTLKPVQSTQSCWYILLRNRLRYGVWISAAILITDTCLRFSWVLRFYDKLFPSNDSFVLCTQFLEVLRRALWNLLRVEWENMKQSGQHIPSAPKSPTVQLVPISLATLSTPSNSTSDDTNSLIQRGSVVGSKSLSKITVEKNAEA